MKQRLIKAIITGAVIAAAGCAYALIYIRTGFAIPCVFRLVTGLECPGCGVTHMMINLIKLDFGAAFRSNPAVFSMLPVLIYLFGAGIYRYIRYGRNNAPKAENIIGIVLIAVLIAFGILRNIISIF